MTTGPAMTGQISEDSMTYMQKITPCLWFNQNAEEAVQFYSSAFKNSKTLNTTRYGEAGSEASGQPQGSVMTVTFELEGQEFTALNGGPHFKFTPAVSFFVNCENEQGIDELWAKLSAGGSVLMGLDKYPFSKKFGWVQDKYGVSWQMTLTGQKTKISPFLLFVGEQNGKAEEAMTFYTSLFENSGITKVVPYGAGQGEKEGNVQHAVFSLGGQELMAMESGRDHRFAFTPAISLFVKCETQAEVDRLWNGFTEHGEAGQCGWLTDAYGVSWQIVPKVLPEMLLDRNPRKSETVMRAMVQMNKLDIDTLKQAYTST